MGGEIKYIQYMYFILTLELHQRLDDEMQLKGSLPPSSTLTL